ncbi:MAG: hypothetical protein ACR2GW_10455 [Pyrinomonadaceae bacterium]|nr:hypothetical protein [Acidobacteriota bacterium]
MKTSERSVMMDENKNKHDAEASDKQQTQAELSPSEKLEDEKPLASSIPGAENPESEEIKKEINLNTE